ncbi:hypothetical protein XarbCFBP7408_13800 [Xanthomonas arboricola pv. guizotiae]|uniref:Uncharacterized protein n=1 Tax=Xanthomonas arboricola pv. guizotiae TaxID=487867 RepID=A0A2S7A1M4_9XANT|nr:hypothetical protein XarbCFBP7409_10555 [Xanthomonas arboricola pv. guizotiae]PPU22691.1 hypothetical protein XarbCFBP7408_13800 [Xanthomonas arboricola pv. guizotiae]
MPLRRQLNECVERQAKRAAGLFDKRTPMQAAVLNALCDRPSVPVTLQRPVRRCRVAALQYRCAVEGRRSFQRACVFVVAALRERMAMREVANAAALPTRITR